MSKRRIGRSPLQFSIAGIGIELSWEGGGLDKEPTHIYYEPFLVNGQQRRTDARLRVRCGPLPRVKPEAMIFDALNNRWRLFRVNGQYLFEFFHTKPPHHRWQVAFMASDFSSGELYRRPDKTYPRKAWSLTQLMRPFGELLLVNLLSQGRGILVHGLAVCDQGEGLLFIGRSGAGKSTLANLYKPYSGVSILGDERVVVTRLGEQFWLSGTPWPGGGFTVSHDTVPLRRIFCLEHGPRNALIPDAYLNLYGLLFQQIFLPFWNGEALAFAMGLGEELVRTVPTCRLAFVNDARVIAFLRQKN